MRIGVPMETAAGERRVALVPDGVKALVGAGLEVDVELGAGRWAHHDDSAYEQAGARLVSDVRSDTDLYLCFAKPELATVDRLKDGSALVGLLQARTSPDLLQRLQDKQLTGFSLELIPRIARAQSMDVVTSQASLSGYKAVLLGAATLGKVLPMMMTAAGTIAPARVLVMGTGVAGLQAIATARRLGAVVQGYDVRAAAKEQVESLGATFFSPEGAGQSEAAGGYAQALAEEAQERERKRLLEIVGNADIIITTALIPGRKAPVLLTTEMVEAMRPGSVVVDLAAEMGGNCELTQSGATVEHQAVTVLGPVNVPSSMPTHASQLFSRNVTTFLQHVVRDGQLELDFDDAITNDCCVSHAGQVRHGLSVSTPAEVARA